MNFESTLLSLSPIIFSLAGLILALYIYITKQNKKKALVCPIGGHCTAVVNSKYSKFLGVPVELMGAGYYMLIMSVYAIRVFRPEFFSDIFMFLVTAFSVGAFFFSLYLVFIQAFALKNWCTWCLFSAGFTTFIAVTSVFGASFDLVALLAEYKGLVVFFHAFAAAVGVGATTVTDVLFFKFLKDFKISKGEKSIMDTMSHIIWVALGVLILTGIGLYIPASESLLVSSKFLVKVCVVALITLNGLLLNFIISPWLTRIDFDELNPYKGESRVYRKISFASGAVSISSWYIVFLLGSLRSIPLTFKSGLLVYVGVVILAISFSQYYEGTLVKKHKEFKQFADQNDM